MSDGKSDGKADLPSGNPSAGVDTASNNIPLGSPPAAPEPPPPGAPAPDAKKPEKKDQISGMSEWAKSFKKNMDDATLKRKEKEAEEAKNDPNPIRAQMARYELLMTKFMLWRSEKILELFDSWDNRYQSSGESSGQRARREMIEGIEGKLKENREEQKKCQKTLDEEIPAKRAEIEKFKQEITQSKAAIEKTPEDKRTKEQNDNLTMYNTALANLDKESNELDNFAKKIQDKQTQLKKDEVQIEWKLFFIKDPKKAKEELQKLKEAEEASNLKATQDSVRQNFKEQVLPEIRSKSTKPSPMLSPAMSETEFKKAEPIDTINMGIDGSELRSKQDPRAEEEILEELEKSMNTEPPPSPKPSFTLSSPSSTPGHGVISPNVGSDGKPLGKVSEKHEGLSPEDEEQDNNRTYDID